MVRWRRVNLMEDMSPLGPFDMVFCRNALGGLVESARTRVLDGLGQLLAPGGCLVLGPNDAAPGLTGSPEQAGIYRAAAGRRAAA
jgi:chemotaxis protein methyltransferase CheR